jgi:integrase
VGLAGGPVKNKLTALEVKNAGDGKLHDGDGLMLDKTGDKGKWLWRYTFAGKRREMGLGAYPAISMATARKARDKWADVLAEGRDPVTERQRLLEAERREIERVDPTLAEVVDLVFEARKAGLRGDGDRGRWMSPLSTHVLPKIGKRPLSQLSQADLKAALAPIWRVKPATAEKAIQRLGIVFRQAKLMGLDCDPFIVDQARHMLGHVIRVTTPIVSTPWQDVPAVFKRLGDSASHQAIKLVILTAARSHSVRGATFDEFEGDVWTIPAARMKGTEGRAKSFRVPLSTAAQAVVQACREIAHNDYLFPSYRVGHLSDRAMEKALDDMGIAGRPHGFRSSFRSWVQDTDACSYDVAETILAHQVGGKVERTYARSDMLEKRRPVMEAWGRYCAGTTTAAR